MSLKKPETDQNLEHEPIESEQIETIQDQSELDTCKAALADWQSKYALLAADFENYKKRMLKDQTSFAVHSQAALLGNLLFIVDNFDRAMEHEIDKDGIAMIYESLAEFLQKVGVKEIACDIFNPEFHEALIQVESADHKEGEIVEVMEKGYMLGDRVLRPAKVSVAK